jgi:predicted Rossmann fold flavoprotein
VTSPYDLLIIGAGPAGLFTAIHAAKSGHRVCILEKNESAGVKLLLTGAGKCNLTHSGAREEFLVHYGDKVKGRFVKPALYGFTNNDLCRFFNDRGLGTVTIDDGKIFPAFLNSHDVVRALVGECGNRGVEIRYRETATSIERAATGFIVLTAGGILESRSVVIATGGKSYPKTGSTGDGYIFAKRFGHSIIEPAPALSPITVRDYPFVACSGISIRNAKITIQRNGEKNTSTAGDVLFTHHGLSGPGILDMSRYLESGDTITMSLFPSDQYDGFEGRLARDMAANAGTSLKRCLAHYGIPERLLTTALGIAGIPVNVPCSTIDRKTRSVLISRLMNLTFKIAQVNGFDQAMATRGGVTLAEIHPSSMESRLVPGLFFAGEVLDVDGDTGGYNLQFAFSSGYVAGSNIISRR